MVPAAISKRSDKMIKTKTAELTEMEREYLQNTISRLKEFYARGTRKGLYRLILLSVEKPLIEATLDKTGGNQCKAARILGINRNTLHSKVKKYGINLERWR